LLLLQYDRAGTPVLRAHFREEIDAVLERRNVLKERLATTKELDREDHSIYFSSWMFAAIHVQLAVPPFQTRESIARALQIPVSRVAEILEFLVSRKLAQQTGDQFSVGEFHLHLGNDSSMIAKHHTNWRLKAMQALEQHRKNDLHYSSVIAISKTDAKRLKAFFADSLTDARQIIAPSKEEELYCISLDFFGLSQEN
jgi:hypothetical protein